MAKIEILILLLYFCCLTYTKSVHERMNKIIEEFSNDPYNRVVNSDDITSTKGWYCANSTNVRKCDYNSNGTQAQFVSTFNSSPFIALQTSFTGKVVVGDNDVAPGATSKVSKEIEDFVQQMIKEMQKTADNMFKSIMDGF